MFDPEDHVTLATIGGGAASERFNVELQRVLENIYDINTPWKKTREVTIKIKLTPANEKRGLIGVDIESSSKLAGFSGVDTSLFLNKVGGEFIAHEHNPEQMQLDMDEANPPSHIKEVEGNE